MSDGLFKKLKALVGVEEVEEDDYEEEERGIPAYAERQFSSVRPAAYAPQPQPQPQPQIRTQPARAEFKEVSDPRDKVISMNKAFTSQFSIFVTAPKSFEECPSLVDNLKCRKPVIISLEKLDAAAARKIFDFLSGATYALNGNIQRIVNGAFVFAPESVNVLTAQAVSSKETDFGLGVKNPWR
jgi:cell division inhibitor SepF